MNRYMYVRIDVGIWNSTCTYMVHVMYVPCMVHVVCGDSVENGESGSSYNVLPQIIDIICGVIGLCSHSWNYSVFIILERTCADTSSSQLLCFCFSINLQQSFYIACLLHVQINNTF